MFFSSKNTKNCLNLSVWHSTLRAFPDNFKPSALALSYLPLCHFFFIFPYFLISHSAKCVSHSSRNALLTFKFAILAVFRNTLSARILHSALAAIRTLRVPQNTPYRTLFKNFPHHQSCKATKRKLCFSTVKATKQHHEGAVFATQTPFRGFTISISPSKDKTIHVSFCKEKSVFNLQHDFSRTVPFPQHFTPYTATVSELPLPSYALLHQVNSRKIAKNLFNN